MQDTLCEHTLSTRPIPNDESLSETTTDIQDKSGSLLQQAELRSCLLKKRLEKLEKENAALQLKLSALTVRQFFDTCFSSCLVS